MGREAYLGAFDEAPSAKQKLSWFWSLETMAAQGKRQRAHGLSNFRKQIQQNTGELILRGAWNYLLARDWKKFSLCLSVSLAYVTVIRNAVIARLSRVDFMEKIYFAELYELYGFSLIAGLPQDV